MNITLRDVGVFGLGGVAALVLIGGIAVYVINIIIPWEAICATLGPMQTLSTQASALLGELRTWLGGAEALLASASTADVPDEMSSGLGGLIDRAADIASDASSSVLNVVTAPLRGLIAAAEGVVAAVQAVLDSVTDAIASIDASRCQ